MLHPDPQGVTLGAVRRYLRDEVSDLAACGLFVDFFGCGLRGGGSEHERARRGRGACAPRHGIMDARACVRATAQAAAKG